MGLCTSAFIRRSGTIIPVGTVGRITEELLSHGRVFRGYLGLGLQPAELPAGAGAADSSGGLLVAAVQAGGPAEQGGVIVGDILISLDSRPCRAAEDVLAVLGSTRPDQVLEAVLVRGGNRREVTLVVGERPQRQSCP